MSDDVHQNKSKFSEETLANWPARVGGMLIFLGTGLSMVSQGWQADVAIGVALLGLVLVLGGRKKSSAR